MQKTPPSGIMQIRSGEGGMDLVEIMVAGMSLLGTLAGTLGGILVSSRLTNYRLEQLEKKVAEHNRLVERTYILEGQMRTVQRDLQSWKGA